MRVHELAKVLGLSTKEMMDELKRIKVPVEHHSNTLDDEVVRKIRAAHEARQSGGGVIKKVTRRPGEGATPAPSQPLSSSPASLTSGPRLVKRVLPAPPPPPRPMAGSSLGAPRPIPLGAPRMPVPEGPPMPGMSPVLPPPALRIKPPASIEPPKPVGKALAPLTAMPPVSLPQPPEAAPLSPPVVPRPSSTSMPPQAAPPAPPRPGSPGGRPAGPPHRTGTGPRTGASGSPSQAAPPQQRPGPGRGPRRDGGRPAPGGEKRRSTTIDLDTFKTVVTGQPNAPAVPGAAKTGRPSRRRGGDDRRRREHADRVDKERSKEETGERKFRPSFVLQAGQGTRRRDSREGARAGRGGGPSEPAKPKAVTIYGKVTVSEFAEKVGVASVEVMRRLMQMGEMLTINAVLSDELAELLAGELNINLTIVPETDEYDVREFEVEDRPEDHVPRPPVVTVMGHVDHGKTSLLDRIRATNVAEGEAGGITQHIGASSVRTAKGEVTFLDTPGHEAFTAMRARGAEVTDLVVLVVAANDGIMPQTIEAINHAKAAEVPIIVAINKIDMPGANPDRVKQGLMSHGLVPEDFGGDTICVPVSAKTGQSVEQLLEMIALQSEVLELTANPKRHGEGIVIEACVEPGRGVTATVLVQEGTLRIGDSVLAGAESGKIRAMNDDKGNPVDEVLPGHAAEIFGLRGAPTAGESFLVVPNERIAREIADRRTARRRVAGLAATPGLHTFTDETGAVRLAAPGESAPKDLKLIIRADVQGSVEAVSQSLLRLATPEVKVEVLHSGVGAITTSDVNLAATTGAHIIGFGVRPEAQAAALAEQEHVRIHLHSIIYELIDDVKAAMTGMLDPSFQEKSHGRAEIRQVFKISRLGNIAGCYVLDGEIARSHHIRLLRDGAVVTEKRRLASLKRVKDDVSKVAAGVECGMVIDGFNDIREGDVIEAYSIEQVASALSS